MVIEVYRREGLLTFDRTGDPVALLHAPDGCEVLSPGRVQYDPTTLRPLAPETLLSVPSDPTTAYCLTASHIVGLATRGDVRFRFIVADLPRPIDVRTN